MPITWMVDDRGDRVNVTFSDPYTMADSERAMREIFASPDVRRPLRFLVDVRSSTPPTTEFVVSAITFWQLHVSEMWDAKVAVITSDDAQAAKAELSQDSAESRELPFTIRNFTAADGDAARRWLSA